MKGIRIDSEPRFGRLFEGLREEVARLFWLLDLQGGPFDYLGRDDWEEIDRQLDEYFVDDEEILGTLWRPGTLPRFAPLLIHDEWSYLVGLAAPEEAARGAAKELFAGGGYLTPEFFAVFERRGRIFAALAEGYWEIYSTERQWLSRLAEAWRATPVDSSSWDSPDR